MKTFIALALIVLMQSLMARDYTTTLTVIAASDEEAAVVIKILKAHIDAETDEKRIAVLHDVFRKLAVDSLSKKGKPLPELNAESREVVKFREEQPKLATMHDSLVAKDGKCRVWRLKADAAHPELIIQYIDGNVTYQKSIRRNSEGDWYAPIVTTSVYNPLVVSR